MRWCMSLCLVLLLSGSLSLAGGASQSVGAQLQQAYPEVRFHWEGTELARVWGTAFGYGLSPEHSATSFVQAYSGLYGLNPDELTPGNTLNGQITDELMFDPQTGTYKLTLFHYTQVKDGIPVFNCNLRLLVENQAGYPLVWAGSSLRDLGDFSVPADALANINEEAAHTAALAAQPDLLNFGPYSITIWPGDKQTAPAVAIVFEADNGMQFLPEWGKWLFVADATSGVILLKESRIIYTDVTGSVHGMSTTIPKSAECNPEVDMVMRYAKVAIGATTAYADANGNFTIPNAGSSPVTVTSYMSGTRFVVADQGGSLETLTLTVTPPGPANFMHNAANTSEFIRAEVNGYVQANVVRDWVLTYKPNYPTINTQTNFAVNVNINSTCNAYYDGSSINFYRAGGGCANTSYSNIVHHEYGHHVVAMGGSGQDAYGEGMSDTVGTLIGDDPVCGYGFEGNCNAGIRTAANNFQYPCSGEIHYCGQLLSGCIWSTRNELYATHPSDYLAIISNLTVNSVPMHSGGSITRSIYTDFITLDNSFYGGAHYAEITAGFAAHNMVPAPPPPNDACANAIVVCPGAAAVGTTSNATLDGSTTCGTSNSTPDVWYKYTPATSGSATFSLCGSGTTYDSVMSIHSGCPGTSSNSLNCDDDGCGGSSAPSTITRSVTAGTTYIIRISGWSGAAGAYSLTITGPACQTTTYTLTTSVVGQGSITLNPPGPTYPAGTVVTVTANAAAGWHFDHWSGDLSGSTNPTTITMNSNKSITATFVQDQYTLTTSVVGQGSITLNPPGPTYPSGTVVTVTANAAAGWHFDHWSGDLSGSTNPTTITMNGNKSITATFVQDQYTLTVNIVGQGTVTLNPPGGTYLSGTTVQVTANPAAGWHFDHWAGDLSGTTNPTSILMGSDHTITVVFGKLGDMNCDGVVDFADINPFVVGLAGQGEYTAQYPNCLWLNGDINADGLVDFADINPFVALLGG